MATRAQMSRGVDAEAWCTTPVAPLFPVLDLRVDPRGTHAEGPAVWRWGHQVARPTPPHDGVFAGWSVEGSRLTAFNDRYGFAPLYYAASPTRFLISPNPLAIVARLPEAPLDDAAMAVFVRRGFFIGEDTAWRDVRALPPDGRLEWDAGRLSLSGAITIRKACRIGYEEALDSYIDLFRAAVARRPPTDNTVHPLSGGRDSRHILFELARQKMLPRSCMTVDRFARTEWDDTSTAAVIAGKVGARHEIVRYRRSWTGYERIKNVRTGFCSDEHNHFMVLAEHAEGRFDCAYDGIAGDVMSAAHFITPERLAMMREGRFEDMAREILEPPEGGYSYTMWAAVVSEAAAGWLLWPDQKRRWTRDAAIERIARELRLHADAPNPVDSFYLFNRTRRKIALSPYAVLRGVPTVYSPFMDHDVFDFLMSLPAEMVIDHLFHTRAIQRAFPEHADPPFARGLGAGVFRTPLAENLRWLGELCALTLRANPARLPTIAAYVRNHRRGGPLGRCSRAMVLLLTQFEKAAAPRAARALLHAFRAHL